MFGIKWFKKKEVNADIIVFLTSVEECFPEFHKKLVLSDFAKTDKRLALQNIYLKLRKDNSI